MNNYYFDPNSRFVIENYTTAKTFSSFLPGISGIKGIPMWVFYVNRGQCISSFGIKNKDNPMMEFLPAYKAYQRVETEGFRTFIKLKGDNGEKYYEPFSGRVHEKEHHKKMYIGAGELEIEEHNDELGLQTNVLYFTLPEENIAALIRKVTIKNTSLTEQHMEVLDGMPSIIPYGVNNEGLKEVGNTLKAWMSVSWTGNGTPYYRLRSSSDDSASVSEIQEGNFYFSFLENEQGIKTLRAIVDPDIVFEDNTSFSYSKGFIKNSIEGLFSKGQITSNKVPCGFSGASAVLRPGESISIYGLAGHAESMEILQKYSGYFIKPGYVMEKYRANNAVINCLTEDIYTRTSSRVFDEYCKQTYLDNLMRGGYPIKLSRGSKSHIYYVYSRKHGDLERDYNYFVIEPEFYSCGNGNYRDVNQNRRNDIFFHPEIGEQNIKTFMNLIQADGYNPLIINGIKYRLKEDITGLIDKLTDNGKKLNEFFKDSYTPGKLFKFIENHNILLKVPEEELLENILGKSEEFIDSVHGEGYWTDHWTYNLDLIESYLSIYPDKERELLFGENSYTYYDSAEAVLKRSKRYVLSNGRVRQYKAVEKDKYKDKLIEGRDKDKNIMRTGGGTGAIYKTTLLAKLINLAVIKSATSDPRGMGIEMEAGKPGWYDALNGLPGIFGSSMAETYELDRLLSFIIDEANRYGDINIKMPIEVWELLESLTELIKAYNEAPEESRDHSYWEGISDAREYYRERIRLGFSGEEREVPLGILMPYLNMLQSKISYGIKRAVEENSGIFPTYFYYEVKRYQRHENKDETGGDPEIRILEFRQKKLPLFLEGAVRGFKTTNDRDYLGDIYKRIKGSPLFDEKLKMYKVNESLESESIEIGRARAFTRGWLENESIWLHMEYKYILEVLRKGLYEEFYSDFPNVLIPFQKAEVYGRSPLENSSFIASSANEDESIHGNGFVARLSGATAEFLSMWRIIFSGEKPFYIEDGRLKLKLMPAVPGWLFDENNSVSFRFLGNCIVTYHNAERKNTYETDLSNAKTVLHMEEGEIVNIEGNVIDEDHVILVREGKAASIDMYI